MTQEEILDYNKRCAKFLGAELYIPKPWYYLPKYQEHYYFKNRYEPNRFTLKMMKFHSDWNWIMEVCISLGMEFVTTNKEQLIQQIYDKLKT